MPEDPAAFFWAAAEPILGSPGAERGTMMGFPCVRVGGAFLASCDPSSGDLIVKLPEERVHALIEGSTGEPFAPAGRVFREWVKVSERDATLWRALLTEAGDFASTNAASRRAR